MSKHRLRGEAATRRVWLDGVELDPGPDGFNWGYGGSGPAQLALAVCLAITRDRSVALALYQQFQWDVIAGLDGDFDIETEICIPPAIEQDAQNPAQRSVNPPPHSPAFRAFARRPGCGECAEDCYHCPREQEVTDAGV
jgi:hypothetical protein